MIRAISHALPVTSSTTRSSLPRLCANSSITSGRVAIRPADRTLPASAIATSQKSRCTSSPIDLTLRSLRRHHRRLGRTVGQRHRRIRARSATRPVARGGHRFVGLQAHRRKRPAHIAFSRRPLKPSARTVIRDPDGALGSIFMPRLRESAPAVAGPSWGVVRHRRHVRAESQRGTPCRPHPRWIPVAVAGRRPPFPGISLVARRGARAIAIFPADYAIRPDDLARTVEQRGFESLFFTDHTHIPATPATRELMQEQNGGVLPHVTSPQHDPFVALTYAAAATRTLRLGAGVLLVPQREPIATAKTLATLDVLSRGRLLIGVGVGWIREGDRQ